MPEKPSLGPIHTPSLPVRGEPLPVGKGGVFGHRNVKKVPAEQLLKNLLKILAQFGKGLNERSVASLTEQQEQSQPILRAEQARSVIPEFIPGKVKAAPTLDDVERQQQLGEGSYGKVFMVTNRKGQEQIQQTPGRLQKQYVEKDQKFVGSRREKAEQLESASKEVALQKQAPGAPKVSDERVRANHHQVMMGYAGSPLSDLMMDKNSGERSALSDGLTRDLARQLVGQMSETHDIGIIHRDIKPDNVLVNHQGKATLVDFGVSDQVQGSSAPRDVFFDEMIGSPAYMAPEVTSGQPYTMKADVFSMGVMLTEMLTGERVELVRVTESESGMISVVHLPSAMRKLVAMIKKHPRLSPLAKDLLLKMLERNPNVRISSSEAAAHPYFTGAGSFAELSAPELQTIHRNTILQLAESEQQFDAVEKQYLQTSSKEDLQRLIALEDKISELGDKVKNLQEYISIKEQESQAGPRHVSENGPDSMEIEFEELSDESFADVEDAPDASDVILSDLDAATMIVREEEPEDYDLASSTMIIKDDEQSDSDLSSSTMIIHEDKSAEKRNPAIATEQSTRVPPLKKIR